MSETGDSLSELSLNPVVEIPPVMTPVNPNIIATLVGFPSCRNNRVLILHLVRKTLNP